MPKITELCKYSDSFVWGDKEIRDVVLVATKDLVVKQGTLLSMDATGKFIPYIKGTSDKINGVFAMEDTTFETAGDVGITAVVQGNIREYSIIIQADGDNSNVGFKEFELMQDTGLTPVRVEDK